MPTSRPRPRSNSYPQEDYHEEGEGEGQDDSYAAIFNTNVLVGALISWALLVLSRTHWQVFSPQHYHPSPEKRPCSPTSIGSTDGEEEISGNGWSSDGTGAQRVWSISSPSKSSPYGERGTNIDIGEPGAFLAPNLLISHSVSPPSYSNSGPGGKDWRLLREKSPWAVTMGRKTHTPAISLPVPGMSRPLHRGELIQNRYVLQDFIQPLGVTYLEEGVRQHVHDLAFVTPELKQLAPAPRPPPFLSSPRGLNALGRGVAPGMTERQGDALETRRDGAVVPSFRHPGVRTDEWEGGEEGGEEGEGDGEGEGLDLVGGRGLSLVSSQGQRPSRREAKAGARGRAILPPFLISPPLSSGGEGGRAGGREAGRAQEGMSMLEVEEYLARGFRQWQEGVEGEVGEGEGGFARRAGWGAGEGEGSRREGEAVWREVGGEVGGEDGDEEDVEGTGREQAERWRLGRKFEGGANGEIWRAHRVVKVEDGGLGLSEDRYVMKRMAVGPGLEEAWRGGLREVAFGRRLQGRPHVARYVEHFYRSGRRKGGRKGREGGTTEDTAEEEEEGLELWIVFHDEGTSLRRYLYSPTCSPASPSSPLSPLSSSLTPHDSPRPGDSSSPPPSSTPPSSPSPLPQDALLFEPSAFWRRIRLSPGGDNVLKGLLRQLLEGIAEVHAAGAAHRDLKPSNLILNFQARPDGVEAILKLADFSSAVDLEEGPTQGKGGLYGDAGPGQGEETLEYMPPEALFHPSRPFALGQAVAYDMWSVGVIFLELILGTPHVFTLSSRDRSLLGHQLRRESETTRQQAYVLAALADFCVVAPESGEWGNDEEEGGRGRGAWAEAVQGLWRQRHHAPPHFPSPPSPPPSFHTCTLDDLRRALQQRDPLDVGFDDPWGLHLLSRLLQWCPEDRIGARDALAHAFFQGPYVCSVDHSEHATQEEQARCEAGQGGHARKEAGQGGRGGVARVAVTAVGRSLMDISSSFFSSLAPSRPGPKGGDSGAISPSSRRKEGDGRSLATPFPPPSSPSPPPPSTLFSVPSHQHPPGPSSFACPSCARTFPEWSACHAHVRARGHGRFCRYNVSSSPSLPPSLPTCIGSHALLPVDPHSGWCDVQGRRRTLEDYHSMGWGGGREGGREGGRVGGREGEYQYYGIYDGHWGTKAAKFASATLHAHFAAIWEGEGEGGREGGVDPEALREAVREAFWRTNEDLKTLLKLSRGREGGKEGGREGGREGEAYDRSGTTATLALLFPEAGLLLVANVGDSRAVLCCEAGEEGGKEGGKERAVEMTVDHTASNLEERRVLETQGARVWRLQVREGRKGGGRDGDGEGRGGEDVWRLEGELALSRSLGDFQYDRFLSRDPHISLFSLAHGKGGREGGREGGRGGYRYLVLASDGLWDVMSNEDVVAFVDEKMSEVLRKGGREGMAQAGIEGESQCGEGGEGREGSEGRGSGGLEGWGVDWHALARALTWEAYVRGSTDNIGVLIVDLNR